MFKIMVVDDEPMILTAISRQLHGSQYELCAYENPLEAAAALDMDMSTVDLIIADYRMPGMNGIELLDHAKKTCPNALRIIISGYSDLEFLKDAINHAEIYRFISKPWDTFDFKMAIQQALAFSNLQKSNNQLLAEVKAQESKIEQQRNEIERLEQLSPGITEVMRDNDGSIVLDENQC